MVDSSADPRVSVLMPSFRHERFVETAVRSVLRQTMSDLELIIVDDASPDGSPELLRTLAAQDPRVRLVLRADNQGLIATLSEALALARGEIVAVIASDDVWHADKLALQCQALEGPGTWTYAQARLIDEQGVPLGSEWGEPCGRDGLSPFEGLLLRNVVPALTLAVERSLLLAVGGWRTGVLFEDYDLALRLAAAQEPVYLPVVLADYRVVGNSLSQTITAEGKDLAALAECLTGVLDSLAPADPRRELVASWRRARMTVSQLLSGDDVTDVRAEDRDRVLLALHVHVPPELTFRQRRQLLRRLRDANPELLDMRTRLRGGWVVRGGAGRSRQAQATGSPS